MSDIYIRHPTNTVNLRLTSEKLPAFPGYIYHPLSRRWALESSEIPSRMSSQPHVHNHLSLNGGSNGNPGIQLGLSSSHKLGNVRRNRNCSTPRTTTSSCMRVLLLFRYRDAATPWVGMMLSRLVKQLFQQRQRQWDNHKTAFCNNLSDYERSGMTGDPCPEWEL